ncbi:uncharacterized protein PAC_02430 [Phialocephala subalpina]|uniref:Uncharacterized protein n=1 Tax=Phialocephala subalpina TaxID=576137 RepID=A0A1L7WIE6_9HELO|nr:uncharacterized protein PAC_02430 [Phialocephala subalpina]
MAELRGAIMMGGKEVKIIAIKSLDIPSPTKLKLIADNEKILKEWKDFLATNPVTDERLNDGKQYSVALPDETKLQYVVQKHECVLFIDADTGKVIGAYIEDMIGDDDIRMVLNGTVTNYHNNVRKTIGALMASVGYTSGSRDTRTLQWAASLRPGVDMNSQVYKISCAYAYIYCELEQYLPKEVLEDFQNAQPKLDGLAVDAGARDASSNLKYSMNIHGEEVALEIHKLAPPAGQCTLNYCPRDISKHPKQSSNNSWLLRVHPNVKGIYICSKR